MMTTTTKVRRGFDEIAPVYEIACKHDSYIAGGYAAYMATPQVNWQPGDIDIFPPTDKALYGMIAEYQKMGYDDFSESLNACTLEYSDWGELSEDDIRWKAIQLVKPLVGDDCIPEGLIKRFDLTVCCAVLVSPDCVMVHDDLINDTINRRLRFNHINNPLAAAMRLLKYSRKGGVASASVVANLFEMYADAPVEKRQGLLNLMLNNGITTEQFDDEEAGYREDWYDDDSA